MHTRALVRLANMTQASTTFFMDKSAVRHLGKLITHLKEFVIWVLFDIDTADVADVDLWHELIIPCFGTFNFRLEDGTSILADAPGQEIWIHNLFYKNRMMLETPVAQNQAAVVGAVKVHIPLTYFFDSIQYLIPFNDIQEFSFQLAAGSKGANVTVNSLDIRVFADVIYLEKAIRSTIRRSVRRREAAGMLTIPKGRYHYGVISNDKGADANQFDLRMNLNLADFDYSAVDGRVIAMDFHDEMQFFPAGFDNAGATNPTYTVKDEYADVLQPLWWPAGPRSCIPEHGPSGPGSWERLGAADPTTNTLFMLEVLSRAAPAATAAKTQ